MNIESRYQFDIGNVYLLFRDIFWTRIYILLKRYITEVQCVYFLCENPIDGACLGLRTAIIISVILSPYIFVFSLFVLHIFVLYSINSSLRDVLLDELIYAPLIAPPMRLHCAHTTTLMRSCYALNAPPLCPRYCVFTAPTLRSFFAPSYQRNAPLALCR